MVICDWKTVIKRPAYSADGPWIPYTREQVEARLKSWTTTELVCTPECPPTIDGPPDTTWFSPTPIMHVQRDGSYVWNEKEFIWTVTASEPQTIYLLGAMIIGFVLMKLYKAKKNGV